MELGHRGRDAVSDTDVIVVGYGPCGVTAANFLGQYGIRTTVIEREHDCYPRARAVTVDDMTLRLYGWTGLDDELKADMDEVDTLRWKTYDGHEFLRISPAPSPFGQPGSTVIYQPAMERTLRRGVERFADHVHVHSGWELTAIDQDDDGVTATMRELQSGEERSLRGRYLVAADGGSSAVRRMLDIELAGKSHSETWVIIDAEVKRPWPDHHLHTFWSDPQRPVVDIPLALGHHRWELPLRENESRETLGSRETLWALLSELGVSPDDVEIERHAFYEHHVLRARDWRRGRVLLVGDAAHMMPPWAGQGMQSGIRDAVNVAWKLRCVLRGQASPALLDTYQQEREPDVIEMTKLSEALGLMIAARNPVGVRARNRILPIVQRLPGVGPWVREFRFKKVPRLGQGFLSGTPARRDALGRLIPQPAVVSDGERVLFDEVLGDGFAVVGLGADPADVLSADERKGWAAFDARFVTVHGSDASGGIADVENVLLPWAKKHRARVVVLRPDRFVVATDTTGLNPPVLSGHPEDTVSTLTAA